MKKNLITILLLFLLFTAPVFAAVDGMLLMEMHNAENEGDYEKVCTIAQKIMVENPNAPDGFEKYAACMMRAGKYDIAVVNFTNAIKNVDKTIQEDSAMLRKSGWNEQSIKETLNFDSTLYYSYYLRGICYFRLKKYELAWADFEKMKQYSNKTDFNIESLKSATAFELGKYKEALQIANHALSLAKTEENKNYINNLIIHINKKNKK